MGPMNFRIEVRTVIELKRLADFLMENCPPEATLNSLAGDHAADDKCFQEVHLKISNVHNDAYKLYVKLE